MGRTVDRVHAGPKKECAIKFLKSSLFDTPEARDHSIREFKCHASLNHEAVLKLIGFNIPTEKGKDYTTITEFMPNDTLDRLLEKVVKGEAPYNWETIQAINIFGIAAGMAYIHQHDIIHRDLKPSNIFLDENYHPKIGDFGLSKVFKEGTEDQIDQTLGVGTPIYMAPEMIDNPHYSNKIDVYANSLVSYQLLTIQRPYSDKKSITAFSLFSDIQKGVRPTIREREISDSYLDLFERCWSGDPDRRPTFIQIVKEFIDFKDEYFDMSYIDEEEFDDYIGCVTKDLDFQSRFHWQINKDLFYLKIIISYIIQKKKKVCILSKIACISSFIKEILLINKKKS